MAEDRLDAVDFILNTLQEHERSLDRIIAKLGEAADLIRNATLELIEAPLQSHESQVPPPDSPQPMTARPLSENDDRKGTERAEELEMEESSLSAIRPHESIEQFDDYEFSEEKGLLIKILHNLAKLQYPSITDLNRAVEAPRNYLAGFMAGLEATNKVIRRGTPTHKIYLLTKSGEQLYQELQEKAKEVILHG